MKFPRAVLIILCVTLLGSSVTLAQTNVLWANVADILQNPAPGQTLILQRTSPLNGTWGASLTLNVPRMRTADTNGNVTWTNVIYGNYRLFAPGQVATGWSFPVYTNTLGSNNIAALVTNTVPVPNPATNYVTWAQLGAQLAGLSGGSGLPLFPGTNTFVTQVNGSNQVNVPFGLFDLFGAAAAVTNNGLAALSTGNGAGLSILSWASMTNQDTTGVTPQTGMPANTNFTDTVGPALVSLSGNSKFSFWTPTGFSVYGVNNTSGQSGIVYGDFVSEGITYPGLQGYVQPFLQVKGDGGSFVGYKSDHINKWFQANTNGIRDPFGLLPASTNMLTLNGNGGALTNLNASQLTGTAPLAVLPFTGTNVVTSITAGANVTVTPTTNASGIAVTIASSGGSGGAGAVLNVMTNSLGTWIPTTVSNNVALMVAGIGNGFDGIYTNSGNVTNPGAQYALGQACWFQQLGSTNIVGENVQFPNSGGTFWVLSVNTNQSWGADVWNGTYTNTPISSPFNNPFTAGHIISGNCPTITYATLGTPSAQSELISVPAAQAAILPVVGPIAVNYIDTNKDATLTASGALISGQNPSGQIWLAVQKPFVSIILSPYSGAGNGIPTDSEKSITNTLNWCNTSNIFSAFASNNIGWDARLDVGWDARRNPNGNYISTNMGYPYGGLTWDTNLFPDGIPFIANMVHSMKGTLTMGIYEATNQIVPPATGLCEPQSGGTILAYTNGVGPGGLVYSNSAYKYLEVANLATLPFDATTMHWWGADGLILNDALFPPNEFYALGRATSEGILNPPLLFGLNGFGATNSYTVVTAGIVNGYNISPTNMNIAAMGLGYTTFNQNLWSSMFSNAMMYFPYERAYNSDQHTMGDVTRQFHNGYSYENDANQGGAALLRQYTFDLPTITFAWQGGYARTQIGAGSDVRYYSAEAMLHSIIQFDSPPNGRTNLILTSMSYLTNSGFLSVWQDKGQYSPKPLTLFDTNGSTWFEPSSDGGYWVYAENEGTTTTNLPIYWPPGVTNQACTVTEVWSGAVISNGVTSFSTNMTSGQSCLLKIKPILLSGNGGGLTNLNASAINLGTALFLSTGTSAFIGGTNINGAELVLTNSNTASWAGFTAQANNGNFGTNYLGVYENNSAYVPGSTVVGSTNSAIIEINGGDGFVDMIGPNTRNFYFDSRSSTNSATVTNIDFTGNFGNFLVPLEWNGATVITNVAPASGHTNIPVTLSSGAQSFIDLAGWGSGFDTNGAAKNVTNNLSAAILTGTLPLAVLPATINSNDVHQIFFTNTATIIFTTNGTAVTCWIGTNNLSGSAPPINLLTNTATAAAPLIVTNSATIGGGLTVSNSITLAAGQYNGNGNGLTNLPGASVASPMPLVNNLPNWFAWQVSDTPYFSVNAYVPDVSLTWFTNSFGNGAPRALLRQSGNGQPFINIPAGVVIGSNIVTTLCIASTNAITSTMNLEFDEIAGSGGWTYTTNFSNSFTTAAGTNATTLIWTNTVTPSWVNPSWFQCYFVNGVWPANTNIAVLSGKFKFQ